MAILQALLSLIARSASTVLNTIFGWAVRALFGQPSAKEQTFLTGVVAAAAAWPILLVGIAFPKLAALVIAFVPLHNRVPPWAMRLAWIVLALAVPVAVGLAVASKAPPGRGGGSYWRRALRGWPVTVALAAAFLIMFVSVPVLKLASIARRRRDEQVPLITTALDYHDVAQQLIATLNRHGFELERRRPSWWVAAPTRILRRLGGEAFNAYVPETLEYYREPSKRGLEAALYPSCLLVRGEQFAAVRAHGLAMEIATLTTALQTADAQAQALEKRIHGVWAQLETGAAAPVLRDAMAQLCDELNRLRAPFDDWQTLYRQLLQLDRAIAGHEQLLVRAAKEACAGDVGLSPRAADLR